MFTCMSRCVRKDVFLNSVLHNPVITEPIDPVICLMIKGFNGPRVQSPVLRLRLLNQASFSAKSCPSMFS